jgi:hypothetical protein
MKIRGEGGRRKRRKYRRKRKRRGLVKYKGGTNIYSH